MRVTIKLRKSGEVRGGLFGRRHRSRLHPNPLAAFGSLCLHAGAIAFLTMIDAVSPSPPHYQVMMLPLRSDKAIWYFPKDHLPLISSTEQSESGKPKVQLKRPGQVIAAEAPPASRGRQLIWQPPPKLSLEPEKPLPNLIAFTPKPRRPKRIAEPQRSLPEAPPLAVMLALPASLPVTLPGPSKPRPRDFVAPASRTRTSEPQVVLETAPNLTPQAQPQQPSIAVVSLDPARKIEIPPPDGSRSARFAAGPESGSGGGDRIATVVVPGLSVQGGETSSAGIEVSPRKAPKTYHEPSPAEWAEATLGKDSRRAARSMMSAALQPRARVIPLLVEARFPNRPVFTTSFEVGADSSMEWVIWFAEKQVGKGQFMIIRPPVPWNSATKGSETSLPPGQFEIAAVIDQDGLPNSITVLKGGDEEANKTAARLIAEWEFLPALSNGKPIPVDSLIEISFRHRP
jgi:Gram-negative bacterial TonB protein C-terminal